MGEGRDEHRKEAAGVRKRGRRRGRKKRRRRRRRRRRRKRKRKRRRPFLHRKSIQRRWGEWEGERL